MKETDYIAASNLVKLRIAYRVIADVYIDSGDPVTRDNRAEILFPLGQLIEKCEQKLKVTT